MHRPSIKTPSLCRSNDCSYTDTKAKGAEQWQRISYPSRCKSVIMPPRFLSFSNHIYHQTPICLAQGENLILTAGASRVTARHAFRCVNPTFNPHSIQPFMYSTLFKDKVNTLPGYFFFQLTWIFSIEFNTKVQSIWRSSFKKKQKLIIFHIIIKVGL